MIPINEFTLKLKVGKYVIKSIDINSLSLHSISAFHLIQGAKIKIATCHSMLSDLYSLLETQQNDQLLFSYTGGILYIAYDETQFDNTSECSFVVSRNSLKLRSLEDKLDIPNEANDLFIYLSASEIYLLRGEQIPIQLLKAIKDEEKKVYANIS